MTAASTYRRFKPLARLCRVLPVLLVALLLSLAATGAQAHGLAAPAPLIGAARGPAMPFGSVATVASQLPDCAPRGAGAGEDCPGGTGHASHGACAGVSCHAVAGGALPAADFEPCQSGYERIVTVTSDGRIIAPLFHPPKI